MTPLELAVGFVLLSMAPIFWVLVNSDDPFRL